MTFLTILQVCLRIESCKEVIFKLFLNLFAQLSREVCWLIWATVRFRLIMLLNMSKGVTIVVSIRVLLLSSKFSLKALSEQSLEDAFLQLQLNFSLKARLLSITDPRYLYLLVEFISNRPNFKANLPCNMFSLLLVPNNSASVLSFLHLTIKSFLISSLFNICKH